MYKQFALLAAISYYVVAETYSPVLQNRFKEHSTNSLTVAEVPAAVSKDHPQVTSSFKRLSSRLVLIFKGPWLRPAQMLIQSPIVLLFAIYTTVTQGYLLLVFATLGLVYQAQYNFSRGASGLAYLGLAVGLTISQFTLGYLSDKYIARMARICGTHRPEDRLPPLIIGALIIPVSLLAYGWGTHTHVYLFACYDVPHRHVSAACCKRCRGLYCVEIDLLGHSAACGGFVVSAAGIRLGQ
jgi:MFS family permease